MHSLAKLQSAEPPMKKTRTKNAKSGKRSFEERTRWKRQDFSSKAVYCEKYAELEKENAAAWIADNDLTPFKVSEVWFGNSFERIRKEPEHYAKRRGNSDFSLSLAEVKCTCWYIDPKRLPQASKQKKLFGTKTRYGDQNCQ